MRTDTPSIIGVSSISTTISGMAVLDAAKRDARRMNTHGRAVGQPRRDRRAQQSFVGHAFRKRCREIRQLPGVLSNRVERTGVIGTHEFHNGRHKRDGDPGDRAQTGRAQTWRWIDMLAFSFGDARHGTVRSFANPAVVRATTTRATTRRAPPTTCSRGSRVTETATYGCVRANRRADWPWPPGRMPQSCRRY